MREGSGQREKKKINKNKLKRERRRARGVERRIANEARGDVASRHAPGPGEEGGVVPERGEGGVESQRKAEGEEHGVRRDTWQGTSRMGWGCEKEGSSQRATKKRKKIKKTHQVAATSPLAFVGRRAWRRKKTLPLCEREGVPYVPVMLRLCRAVRGSEIQ